MTNENQKPLSSFQIAFLSVSKSDFVLKKIVQMSEKKTLFEAKLTTTFKKEARYVLVKS